MTLAADSARTRRALGPVEFGRPPGRVAPGPRGSVLGGSLRALREDELHLLVDAANRYGDVVRIELGPRAAHVTAHLLRQPDHIHHVLFEARQDYPKSFTYDLLRRALGNGLVTSEGELWTRQRRLIQPMFRHSTVSAFARIMAAASEDLAERWAGLARRGEPVDVAAEMMRLTLDIVGRALFSADLTVSAAEIGTAVGVIVRDVVDRLTSPVGLATLVVPGLPTPANRRTRRALATLDAVVARLVARRRALPDKQRPADLLSMLLAARDDETGQAMSDRQIRDEVMTFLIAGHETTANALAWTWYLLSLHPLVGQRLREELRGVLSGRLPTAGDVDKLHYTRAVVQEAMRMYPPVAVIERDASRDDDIGGYDVAAGTTVIISPWVCHRNPQFWSAPEAFNPDRFLGEQAAHHVRYTYLPFGAGPRQCIGAGFALQEATIALAVLARRFNAELVPGHPVEPQFGVTLRPRWGLIMMLHDDGSTGTD
jgi:cytochrome P450